MIGSYVPINDVSLVSGNSMSHKEGTALNEA
jgi:hypothetical protein